MSRTKKHPAKMNLNITIRPFDEADVDFVISRQLALYKSEYGFTSEIWNSYLKEGVYDLVRRFDADKDCMYILENGGVPSGCVAITHLDGATAQLRFFFIEPEMRGFGVGHRLLDMAIGFCREKRYENVILWSFSKLDAARHLYISKGFRMTETRKNNDWGEPILEERWNLSL